MQNMNRMETKQQIKGILGAVPVCALITICLEVGLAFLHRGGSITKHLIHFAILLLAAEGMVLLYAAVPSVRKLWKRIDQGILSVECRKPWVDVVYAALGMIMLLHHFFVLLYFPRIPAGASRFAPLWIPFAVVTVLVGKLWRNKGFWICTILAAYLFERTYLKEPNLSGETMVYMVSAIYALMICFGFLNVIRQEHRRKVLQVLCSIWTIAAVLYCAAGLYFAWTANKITNLGDGATEIINGRLQIFAEPTITAGAIASGVLFALIGFAITKKTILKLLYLLACLFMATANALTDTRSCFMTISFAIAGMVTLGIWGTVKKHGIACFQSKAILAFVLVLCFAGSAILSLVGQLRLTTAFERIRDRGGLIVSSAQAEADEDTKLDFFDREFITDNPDKVDELLSWRLTFWRTAFGYIQEHPETLILGVSADGSVKTAIQREDHCHNILIQILMEGGIIGLGLFLGLLGYFFFHACKLWKRWDLPLWKRALPVPALAVLLMEMVECLTHFAYGHPPMTVLYFFMGATVAVSKSLSSLEADNCVG